MPALGADLDFVLLPVPADKPKLFEDAGDGVALVPTGQSLYATLSQQPPVVVMAEVRPGEAVLHLLIADQVGNGIDLRVSAVAGMRHSFRSRAARATEPSSMKSGSSPHQRMFSGSPLTVSQLPLSKW